MEPAAPIQPAASKRRQFALSPLRGMSPGVAPFYSFPVRKEMGNAGSICDHLCKSGSWVTSSRFRFLVEACLLSALIWVAPCSIQAGSRASFLHTQGQDIVNE